MKRCFSIIVLCTVLSAPAWGQHEQVHLNILRSEEMPLLLERSQRDLAQENSSRGLLTMGIDIAAQFGSRALTEAFTKAKGKYSSEWKAPVCRDQFYNAPSTYGALDPSGLQFSGLSLSRDVAGQDGQMAEALFLSCSLPKDRLTEFITNHRFTLNLDSLSTDLSKIHAKYKSDKRVSLEINIVFKATWMDQNMDIHGNQELGAFRILLPGLTYDPKNPVYSIGGDKADNKISGYSFFIPRSYSAYKSGDKYVECWGTGEFDIEVSVKEVTGKTGAFTDYLYDSLSKSLPAAISSIATNKQIVGASVAEVIKTY